MNSKTAKLCRRFAVATGRHPRKVKAIWNATPKAARSALRTMMRHDCEP